MKVNEIFCSLQGEGVHTGRAAVFVRFSGCNCSCSFCDTQHEAFEEMSEESVASAVASYGAVPMVVLTGGEPTLQITEHLLDMLRAQGKRVHIETNGTIELPESVLEKIDWVTVSPKTAEVRSGRCDELKVLYWGQDVTAWERTYAQSETAMCLQPLDTGNATENAEIVASVVDYVKTHPCWRLSLQTHKILQIR